MAIRIISILSWLAVGCFPSLTAFAQPESYSFGQVDSLQQREQRNLVVFIHTDWCRFCLAMENTTFKDHEVTRLLNQHFWFIRLDAEQKEDISFGGHVFRYKPGGAGTGVNELAEQLGTIDNKLSFPSVCVLSPENEIVFQAGQFIAAKDFIKIMRVFIEKD